MSFLATKPACFIYGTGNAIRIPGYEVIQKRGEFLKAKCKEGGLYFVRDGGTHWVLMPVHTHTLGIKKEAKL